MDAAGKAPVSTKSSNNNLKSITGITGLVPKFSKDITEYDVMVPFEISSLDIKGIAEDSKAKVLVSGGKTLEVGKTTPIIISVTAEDGSLKIYTINVTRSLHESKAFLKDLSVEGYKLSPTFDRSTISYTLDVDSKVKDLNVKALTEDKDAKVKIEGDKDLKPGKNIITIEVTDKEGFTKTYTITVNKAENENWFLANWWLIGLIFLGIILLVILINISRGGKTIIYNNNNNNNDENNTEGDNNTVTKTKEPENVEGDFIKKPKIIDNYDENLYNDYDDSESVSRLESGPVRPVSAQIQQPSSDSNYQLLDPKTTAKTENKMINQLLDNKHVDEVKNEMTIVATKEYDGEIIDKEYKIIRKYRKR